ncbi:hypothetical protein BDZ94DRAFT_1321556 [Collybia nuda]|uniref:Heterokaryon incompatibility domain-containing protein n=1 Tax=Collybia nuda TaxID=64659 RepID=A0A9P5Y9J8_9AGAR|nr:hypothetical protein BDZ94DRAFT_1321556 [Collybia nuda]
MKETVNIYLVRVSEHQDKTLYLERKADATTNDDYIAISHVWGTPETIQPTEVDGAGVVQLSPGKKDILSILRRDDVCGESWFWMDLFCIDQTESASISISNQLMAIPSIYKSSRCAKVLIEIPVCKTWQSLASRVISNPGADLDVFAVEELAHGRKCPQFLFCDPWFERLWTRQEGLYGHILDMVILNPVTCRRLQISAHSGTQRWAVEGSVLAKRTVAEFFLSDKLVYHGLSPSRSEEVQFQAYLDLVYRHRLDFTKYGGLAGPAPNYSPLSEAWKSGRITTKPRDYVLAVFPDIDGYKVPPNARKMQFPELLADALGQASIRERFEVAPKVPKGMMSVTTSKQSATSWVFQEPLNIGEAYDPFTVLLLAGPRAAPDNEFFAVAKGIALEEIDFSKSNFSRVVDMWVKVADNLRHMVGVSPSGPCTGTMRGNALSEKGLLHQYFFRRFAPSAVALYLPKSKLDTLEFRTTGVVSFDRVRDISEEVFSRELRRFLICLLCGTSLRTADIIFDTADFRIISTFHGKLLALIHRDTMAKARPEDFVLLRTSLSLKQGFLIAHKTSADPIIIGRTVIPAPEFWDSMKAVQV